MSRHSIVSLISQLVPQDNKKLFHTLCEDPLIRIPTRLYARKIIKFYWSNAYIKERIQSCTTKSGITTARRQLQGKLRPRKGQENTSTRIFPLAQYSLQFLPRRTT